MVKTVSRRTANHNNTTNNRHFCLKHQRILLQVGVCRHHCHDTMIVITEDDRMIDDGHDNLGRSIRHLEWCEIIA